VILIPRNPSSGFGFLNADIGPVVFFSPELDSSVFSLSSSLLRSSSSSSFVSPLG